VSRRNAAVTAAIVAANLVVAVALVHSSSFELTARSALAGALLATAEIVLIAAAAYSYGGPRLAVGAAGVWVAAPLVLVGRYFRSDFRPQYHDGVLPVAYGFHARAGTIAACLVLISVALSLRAAGRLAVATAAGAAVGAAALVDPRVWPAFLAPALCLAVGRRPREAALAGIAGALVGVAGLAVFRDLPALPLHWHQMGTSLASIREYSWSVRLLEYLPLAGLVGAARRSAPAAAALGWLLLTLVILPLGRSLSVIDLLVSFVPGLPVYALLVASLPYLVPRRYGSPAAVVTPSQ
jgi:hypothetical protein